MLNHEVARNLEQALGLGEFPLIRRRLFGRVQRMCIKHGDAALYIVAGLLEETKALRDRESGGPATKDSKGRYFSNVVVRRLDENGFWEVNGPNQTQISARKAREVTQQLREEVAAKSSCTSGLSDGSMVAPPPSDWRDGRVCCSVCNQVWEPQLGGHLLRVAPFHCTPGEPNATCPGAGQPLRERGAL